MTSVAETFIDFQLDYLNKESDDQLTNYTMGNFLAITKFVGCMVVELHSHKQRTYMSLEEHIKVARGVYANNLRQMEVVTIVSIFSIIHVTRFAVHC